MELRLQPADHVPQQEFAFFQTLHLELIERCALDDGRDGVIEVTMLGLQGSKFAL